jgi:phosphatidate phosphatase APP1
VRGLYLGLLLIPRVALSADDEALVVFPTYAAQIDDKAKLTVHAWVYEPEDDSSSRKIALDELAQRFEVKSVQRPVFERRMRSFLVDNQRGKSVSAEVSGEAIDLGRTGPDGHVEKTIDVKLGSQASLQIRVSMGGLEQSLSVPVIGPRGVSVVSDIDDTIKVTEVLDKKALLTNTFLEEFRAVEGMAPVYAKWAERGMPIHYLSASPWQLEKELRDFLKSAGFPEGPLHLRKARTKSLKTPKVLLEGARKHKLAELKELLRRFPSRTFILVGDAGEQDPEIYGEMFRSAPERIDRIAIRKVNGADHSEARWKAAFARVPQERWRLFEDPALLEQD